MRAPHCAANSGESRSSVSFAANPYGVPSKNAPFTPSTISSGMFPTRVVITGMPQAAAAKPVYRQTIAASVDGYR